MDLQKLVQKLTRGGSLTDQELELLHSKFSTLVSVLDELRIPSYGLVFNDSHQ